MASAPARTIEALSRRLEDEREERQALAATVESLGQRIESVAVEPEADRFKNEKREVAALVSVLRQERTAARNAIRALQSGQESMKYIEARLPSEIEACQLGQLLSVPEGCEDGGDSSASISFEALGVEVRSLAESVEALSKRMDSLPATAAQDTDATSGTSSGSAATVAAYTLLKCSAAADSKDADALLNEMGGVPTVLHCLREERNRASDIVDSLRRERELCVNSSAAFRRDMEVAQERMDTLRRCAGDLSAHATMSETHRELMLITLGEVRKAQDQVLHDQQSLETERRCAKEVVSQLQEGLANFSAAVGVVEPRVCKAAGSNPSPQTSLVSLLQSFKEHHAVATSMIQELSRQNTDASECMEKWLAEKANLEQQIRSFDDMASTFVADMQKAHDTAMSAAQVLQQRNNDASETKMLLEEHSAQLATMLGYNPSVGSTDAFKTAVYKLQEARSQAVHVLNDLASEKVECNTVMGNLEKLCHTASVKAEVVQRLHEDLGQSTSAAQRAKAATQRLVAELQKCHSQAKDAEHALQRERGEAQVERKRIQEQLNYAGAARSNPSNEQQLQMMISRIQTEKTEAAEALEAHQRIVSASQGQVDALLQATEKLQRERTEAEAVTKSLRDQLIAVWLKNPGGNTASAADAGQGHSSPTVESVAPQSLASGYSQLSSNQPIRSPRVSIRDSNQLPTASPRIVTPQFPTASPLSSPRAVTPLRRAEVEDAAAVVSRLANAAGAGRHSAPLVPGAPLSARRSSTPGSGRGMPESGSYRPRAPTT
eukprot:gnl/TRDRNA2_/TRDRNA2_198443_c0_seq1.p1 gnl/TRDRNA2_/TRDRNA2_198443_c0~~gnl/TRDRNA2_/TRDRNA2_198443_c0_seq1.p1  ORF type:complete len:787 (+),score=165.57 gnl/TRDRNA2_/TRDRNA2_198443_c0_seq1:29-2362(+)